jgi:PAS domain S-box-containing protein
MMNKQAGGESSGAGEETKRLIEELEKAKAYSEGLLQSMVDGLGVTDLMGTIVDANDAILELLGYERGDVIGHPLGHFISPGEMQKVAPAMAQVMAGTPVRSLEIAVKAKDGTEIPVSLSASAVRDAQGNLTALFAVMRDIRETKRLIRQLEEQAAELQAGEEELRATNEELEAANEELREAQEQLVRSERLAAIGQLAGGVGHELRNPLGAIKNAVYYLRGKVSKSDLATTDPRSLEFLDIIDEEVESCNKIISDLLGFSRVGRPAVSPTRMEKVIEDVLARADLPENIVLIKELGTLPQVAVDADLIHHVFINMLQNAKEAMPEGGELRISTRETVGFLEVELSDSGYGIPEEIVGRVFDPLFTTKAKGIGLGLAVCQTIVERHGGSIAVRSEEGRGTSFTVRLPV